MLLIAALSALGLLAVLGAGSARITAWARHRGSPALAVILWLSLSLLVAGLWLIGARSVQQSAGFDAEHVLGVTGFLLMAASVGFWLALSSHLAWTLAADPAVKSHTIYLNGARRALLGAGVWLAAVVALDLSGVLR